jgi:membrane-bound lytic murein transglycosylase D
MKFISFIAFLFFFISCSENEKKKSTVSPEKKMELNQLPDLPDNIDFCGQKIQLKDEDIRERLDRELLVNVYYHSSTVQAIKRANRYFPEIERILKEKGIPDDFKYLAVIESNLVQAVSPAGAQGFWQFMPSTAKEYGLLINEEVDERLNIEKSTYAACDYLKFANDTLKDWVLAAASYNRGIGGLRSDMRWQGTDNYFDTYMNSETGRYVFRILAVKLIFENLEKYGYFIDEDQMYPLLKTKKMTINESIPNLAEWAIKQGINYKILAKLNPWILGNKLSVRNASFDLLLPQRGYNLKPYKRYK